MNVGLTLKTAPTDRLFETLMRNAFRTTLTIGRILEADLDESFALELVRTCNSTNGLDFVDDILDKRGCSDNEVMKTMYSELIDWRAVGRALVMPDQNKETDAPQRSTKQRNERSFAYFIESSMTGLIKIGRSVDPESRLRALQTASPDKLTLLKAIPEQVVSESELHERFSHLRRQGEWFEAADEIREFIESH